MHCDFIQSPSPAYSPPDRDVNLFFQYGELADVGNEVNSILGSRRHGGILHRPIPLGFIFSRSDPLQFLSKSDHLRRRLADLRLADE